jgi:hypothetical protein
MMRSSSEIPTPPTPKRRLPAKVFWTSAGLLLTAILVTLGYLAPPVSAQIAVRNQGYIPFSEPPINYPTHEPTDPVALLQKQLDGGKVSLAYDEKDHGYLKSVLELLKVPVNSQTLVFSKTSFQYTKISPEHPRALYYNDDVYVGSVHDGKTIEIVSFDPMQGAMFYLVDEKKVDKPVFERAELDCTQCHVASGTRGIPGVLLRSVRPVQTGSLLPRARTFVSDQETALKDRWGGWYVTGSLAKDSLANTVFSQPPAAEGAPPAEAKPSPLGQSYDAKSYLAPGSDQVALLVLAHQTQMHNLITLTNYKTRLGLHALTQEKGAVPEPAASLASLPEKTRDQITKPAEQLLRYLLFVNETPLGGIDAKQAIAESAFAREFAARGEKDSKGRSLRDFDLHDRTFKYPCSYLIYSSAFDSIPDTARTYVYHRLLEVLSGEDKSADFAGLSGPDKQAILTILLETKPGLPQEWLDYARANHLRTATQVAGRER